MKRFFHKQKGAFTVFLILILVPMLVISEIMIDASRMMLARTVAYSAADLALNTALTNYDSVLKDMYGLFSVSQSRDELFENLEGYYRQCISQSGLNATDTENVITSVMNYLQNVDGTGEEAINPLNMELVLFETTKLDGGDLTNPYLLKDQIVNFMKYRSPLNTGANFLDAIMSMKNLDKQMDLVKEKTEYYQEEEKMWSECEMAWTALENYYNLNLTEGRYDSARKLLELADTEYPEIHKLAFQDVYDAENYYEDNLYYASGDEGNYTIYYKGVSHRNNLKYYSSDYPPDTAGLEKLVRDCQDAIDVLETKEWDLLQISNINGTYHGIRTIVKYNREAQKSDSYARAIYDLAIAYDNLNNACDAAEQAYEERQKQEEENEKESGQEEGNGSSQQANQGTQSPAAQESNPLDEIVQINGRPAAIRVWQESFQKYCEGEDHPDGVFPLYQESSERVYQLYQSGAVAKAKTRMGILIAQFEMLGFFYEDLLKAYEPDFTNRGSGSGYLADALTHLNNIYKMISPDGDLTKAREEWSSMANSSELAGDSFAQANQEEIENLKQSITEEDVADLIRRVEAVIEVTEEAVLSIEAYQYAGMKIAEITSAKQLLDWLEEIGTVGEDIPYQTAELETYTRDQEAELYQKGDVFSERYRNEQSHPEFRKGNLRLYVYLYQNYKGAQDNEPEPSGRAPEDSEARENQSKEDLEAYKNTLNQTAQTAQGEASGTASLEIKSISELSNRPSSDWGETKTLVSAKGMSMEANTDSASTQGGQGLLSFFGELFDAIGNMAAGLRDDIYVADYILSMFSYDSYEAEILWELGGKKTDLTEVKNAVIPMYESNEGGYTFNSSHPNVETYQEEALSLTLKEISPENNYAYLGEVEYILYGGDHSSNVNSAYGTIFAIRFACNTVYAFMDSEIRNGAQVMATALFGIPPLTFMVPIAQAAIIIGLALAESGVDIACLKAGMAVPLYKSRETWRLSFSGALNELKAMAGEAIEYTACQAIDAVSDTFSDYLNMTDAELDELIDQKGDELTDALNENVNNMLDEYAGIAVNKLINVCTQIQDEIKHDAEKLTEKADKLMDGKVKEATYILENWIEGERADSPNPAGDMIYLAKEAAVKVILERKDEFIKGIFEQLDHVDLGQDIQDAYQELVNQINQAVAGAIDGAAGALKDVKSKMIGELENAAQEGAQSLKNAVSEKVGEYFGNGTSGTGTKSSTLTSFFSFRYSDYLRLFLLVSLLTTEGEESVLLRTADVIQANLGMKTEGYLLKNGAVYLELEAVMRVQPAFLHLDLFNEYDPDDLLETVPWNYISVEQVAGY